MYNTERLLTEIMLCFHDKNWQHTVV